MKIDVKYTFNSTFIQNPMIISRLKESAFNEPELESLNSLANFMQNLKVCLTSAVHADHHDLFFM